MLQALIVSISEINAACTNIKSVLGLTNAPSFDRFREFLQIFSTYGTGYRDDVDYRNYKLRETVSHRSDAVKVLRDIFTII